MPRLDCRAGHDGTSAVDNDPGQRGESSLAEGRRCQNGRAANNDEVADERRARNSHTPSDEMTCYAKEECDEEECGARNVRAPRCSSRILGNNLRYQRAV